jgi:hypothetical protein
MTRARVLVLAVVAAGLATYLTARPGRTAQAAGPATAEATYGDNTEDVARARYAVNAPNHWRKLMVKR